MYLLLEGLAHASLLGVCAFAQKCIDAMRETMQAVPLQALEERVPGRAWPILPPTLHNS